MSADRVGWNRAYGSRTDPSDQGTGLCAGGNSTWCIDTETNHYSNILLPNTLGIIMVDITMSVPGFIFSEAFLKLYRAWSQTAGNQLGCSGKSAGQQQLDVLPARVVLPVSADRPDNAVFPSDR